MNNAKYLENHEKYMSFAIDLAKRFKGIIINADSQQVYKDITIFHGRCIRFEAKRYF